jgi:hypothetical protein
MMPFIPDIAKVHQPMAVAVEITTMLAAAEDAM